MKTKVINALKSPVFWAGIAIGAVGVVAFYSKVKKFVKPIADAVPGSESKGTA